MKEEKIMYESPKIEVLEVVVERGFAGSDEGGFNTPGWKPAW